MNKILENFKNCVLAALMIIVATSTQAIETGKEDIESCLRKLEKTTEGRIGIFAINTGNGQVIHYRADEFFPTGCTSKLIGVSAVLKKSMSDPFLLSQVIHYSQKDLEIGGYNPITKDHVSEGMSIKDLCSASISYSDNTAMNLLLKPLGGIQGMNEFARSIGDPKFRQDHDWPAEALSGGEANVDDSSTPRAMVESLQKLVVGGILSSPQRELLTVWLINTETGKTRIRSVVPKSWIVGNKTGTGVYGTTNDLAILWPPSHAPILIGLYYTTKHKEAERREDVIAAATKFLIQEFTRTDLSLIKS